MELTVLRGGMLTTVQDLGRRGYRADGVPLSGAMDPFALRVANALVGNPENAAALEFTLVGPELELGGNGLVAVTGAECEGVPSWQPFEVKQGGRLSFGACRRGCRGYVAISGGIEVTPVLGSRSTFLRGGWGGFDGRALREGDQLSTRVTGSIGSKLQPERTRWQIDPRMLPRYSSSATVRVIRSAPPTGWKDELFTTQFKVSPHSDRMGCRLLAGLPGYEGGGEAVSAAVVPGTIQVPPNGQPVVLMADAQTIGGYPQAGHVIGVDLPVLAQLRPGDAVRFKEVTLEEAHRLAIARDRSVAILREGLTEKITRTVRSKPA